MLHAVWITQGLSNIHELPRFLSGLRVSGGGMEAVFMVLKFLELVRCSTWMMYTGEAVFLQQQPPPGSKSQIIYFLAALYQCHVNQGSSPLFSHLVLAQHLNVPVEFWMAMSHYYGIIDLLRDEVVWAGKCSADFLYHKNHAALLERERSYLEKGGSVMVPHLAMYVDFL